MKELFIVRHAKSDWSGEIVKDIDRPLNERGYSDAYLMAEKFKKDFYFPNVVISSPATRAINTAFIFCRMFEKKENQVLVKVELYESTADEYLNIINGVTDDIKSIILFGHNPSITNLVNRLNKDVFFDNVPTCGIIHLCFETDSWKEIGNKSLSNKVNHLFPKNFRA